LNPWLLKTALRCGVMITKLAHLMT